jgi:mannose/fructose/N-acetylgalactosamine-specific phosphotransferase system component IID
VADLTGRGRALARLLGVQATWNYERMQGIGMGHAADPLLRGLFDGDPERYRAALARAAGFFNANPYLAAAALGAEIRAEVDRVPPERVERLRTVLSGPLGALGDRLFWSGLVPALASAALALVLLGAGPWPVLGFLVVHNSIRLFLAPWLLRLGWEHGLNVGGALGRSALPRVSVLAEEAAAFAGALAIPLVARRFLAGADRDAVIGVVALVIAALLLRRKAAAGVSPVGLTLVVGAGVILWHWGLG